MIVRAGVIGLLLVTAALLQTAFVPLVVLGGFRPDLLLLVTVAFALHDGPATGVRVGFSAGLLMDLLLNESAAGLSALVYVGVAYAVGVVRPYLAHESMTAPLLLAFLSGLVATGGYGLLSRLMGDQRFTFELVASASLFVAFFNTILAPPVMGLVDRLDERFPLEGTAAVR